MLISGTNQAKKTINQKKSSIYLYRVNLNFGNFFCQLNKASAQRKHSKLSKYHKKVLILHNEIYNEFFKFIGYYFKEMLVQFLDRKSALLAVTGGKAETSVSDKLHESF